MSIISVKRYDGKDLYKKASRCPEVKATRTCGDHDIYTFQDGSIGVSVRRTMGKGLWVKVVKIFAKAGIVITCLYLAYVYVSAFV